MGGSNRRTARRSVPPIVGNARMGGFNRRTARRSVPPIGLEVGCWMGGSVFAGSCAETGAARLYEKAEAPGGGLPLRRVVCLNGLGVFQGPVDGAGVGGVVPFDPGEDLALEKVDGLHERFDLLVDLGEFPHDAG